MTREYLKVYVKFSHYGSVITVDAFKENNNYYYSESGQLIPREVIYWVENYK